MTAQTTARGAGARCLRLGSHWFDYRELDFIVEASRKDAINEPLSDDEVAIIAGLQAQLGAAYWPSIHACWHWSAGALGGAADVVSAAEWADGQLNRFAGLFGADVDLARGRLAGVRVGVALTLQGVSSIRDGAADAAAVFEWMVRAGAGWLGSSASSPTGSGGYEMIREMQALVADWAAVAGYLREGANCTGNLLPDALVYSKLAGPGPLRWGNDLL